MANVLDRLCEMHNFLTSSWHVPNISEIAQEQMKVYSSVIWVEMEGAEPYGSHSCRPIHSVTHSHSVTTQFTTVALSSAILYY